MPDDQKKKNKATEAEAEQASAQETPQGEGTAEQPATVQSAAPQPAPLTIEQMKRIRQRLKAKYH